MTTDRGTAGPLRRRNSTVLAVMIVAAVGLVLFLTRQPVATVEIQPGSAAAAADAATVEEQSDARDADTVEEPAHTTDADIVELPADTNVDAAEPATSGAVPATTGGCSAHGLPATVAPQEQLPAEVASLRERLAELAIACDIDALGAISDPADFSYSFGAHGDPASYWLRLEAEGTDVPMAALRRVLDAPAAVLDIASGGERSYWVWPRLAVMDVGSTAPTDLEDAIDEVVATGLHERALVEQMVHEAGSYLGYRTMIEVPTDGSEPRWSAFIAGD